MNTNRSQILTALGSTLTALLACISSAQASSLTIPNSFLSGNVISSSAMNQNFTNVLNAVNDNNSRLGTAETNITNLTNNKQNRVTGTCPGTKGIRIIAADGNVTCSSGFTSYVSIQAVAHNTSWYGNSMAAGYISGKYGRYQSTGTGTDYVLVPVNLPHGATVTSVSYTCYDNYANDTCKVYLYRNDASTMAYVTTSADSAVPQTVTTTLISYSLIDNANYSYFAWLWTNGTAGLNIMPQQLNITFTMP